MTSAPRLTSYGEERSRILGRSGLSGPARRRALSDASDAWLADLLSAATPDITGLALAAVGGHGRRELSPGSDLDLVLLHDGRPDIAAVADAIWYPVWDSGVRLDHSVRRLEEARKVAAADLPALLGLLDLRLVAGDGSLVDSARSAVLGDWRRSARSRLPQLREACLDREQRHGDVAFTIEPELKEGRGGLRDVTCLRAVAASWVADRPHGDIDGAAQRLLDVRDALHLSTGRASDRLLLQEQDGVATRMGVADADSVLRVVADAARVIGYADDITWRRVEGALRPRRRGLRFGRPVRHRPLSADLIQDGTEAALAANAPVATDPVLPLRAAATAAQANLPLAPDAVVRLATCPPLPDPWPAEARDALVALLGAGAATVRVWEALDQSGIVVGLIPEWGLVRNRPQRNAVHRWTVDRHLIETAAAAAALTRRVARPDLLLVAALLHDLGKGRRRGDHSREGAKLARTVAARLGFDARDVDVLVALVLHHLLLVEAATRRDLEDPATARAVADAVDSAGTLELLSALTEADAIATGPAAWSDWRAALVAELVARTAAQLRGDSLPAAAPLTVEQLRLLHDVAASGQAELLVTGDGRTWTVTVAAPDQRGLIAMAAGVLALHRLSVRAADMRTEMLEAGVEVALDSWVVTAEYVEEPDPVRMREDLRRALAGRLDVAALLDKRQPNRAAALLAPPATVEIVDGASATATVLEVRAHDRPALLHRLGRALALAGLDIHAARVATLGAEVVDVFYVVDEHGRALSAERAREAARILRDVAG